MADQRSPARRDADALVEAMSRLLDEGELPTRGGQRPHLVLTMGLNDLIDSIGSAVLDTGGCVSAAEARRLACDAWIVPMVLGSDSMPLDVGRHQRLATAALRDALAQRDKGCAFLDATAHPDTATPTTSYRGWTGAKQNLTICVCSASATMSSCTGKDGTSGSTPAGIPNSYPHKQWTPPEHHSTTHYDSESGQ